MTSKKSLNMAGMVRLAIVFCLAWHIATEAAFAQKTKALLIAVPRCQDPKIAPLPFTRNDVRNLETTLNKRAEQIEVETFGTDDEKPAKRIKVGRKIVDWLIKDMNKDDTIILYFSGHGYLDKSRNATYLVSSDFDSDEPATTGIPIDNLRTMLENCKAGNKFLIIDSCHSGAPVLGTELDPLNQFENYQGVITLASSKFGEKSHVWGDRQMSLFSYWLNEGLKGHADMNKDAEISVDELYQYVFKNVRRCNRVIAPEEPQTPVRVIGPKVTGIPQIVRIKPVGLDTLLDDIAEQVAMQLDIYYIESLGILDFTIESQGGFALTREQYGLLRLYATSRIEQQVKKRLNETSLNTSYTVYDRAQTKDAITKCFEEINLPKAHADDPAKLMIEGTEVRALLSGNVLGRQSHRFSMQCRLSHPMRDEPIAVAGGTATLSLDDWMMLGISVDLSRQVQQQFENDPQPTREQFVRSLGGFNVKSVLRPANSSPQAIIEKLDELSGRQNPLLQKDFPLTVEIRVKNPDGEYCELRPFIPVGNEVYVALEEGEIYQVRLVPLREANWWSCSDISFAASVLVDGLNTFPEEDCSDTDANAHRYTQAQRVSLERATPWKVPANDALPINGFYTKPTTSRTPARYNEFQVAQAHDSEAAKSSDPDLQQIGLISIAIYPDLTTAPQFVTRGGTPTESIARIGTKLGEQMPSEIEVRACEKIGPLLGVVHLRYDTPDNIQKLQTTFLQKGNHNE